MVLELAILPLFISSIVAAASRGLVVGDRNAAGLNAVEIVNKDFIVSLDFLNSFASAHSLGYVLPAVWGFLVVQG